MSKDDIVKVPKSLLRRVKTEVEDLRAEVARLQAELDAVQSAPPPESASVDLVADLRDQIHEKAAEARAYRLALDKVQTARDALAQDLEAARAQIVELGGDPGDHDLAEFFEAPAEEPPTPSATPPSEAPPDRSTEAALQDGADAATLLRAAADAAEAGAEATRDMTARRGRAAKLGERARGHADPGATSTARILDAMAMVVAAAG